ncbi:hypothetical protein [Roseateles violae]|uniref:Uncharacterized protein n=1 Tax=Roseateles violae TaxID=3058042 RepID=A0ABT8DNZ2_9BURK|nr:hypothetical protein [Pelomonas sp. PFR6]MDN3918649.1 hypothetical protein [Pelomonas sp. PFR6]
MRSAALPLLVLALSACSPSLDWREVRLAEAGALALFPCKPELSSHAPTPAEPARMGLAQCKAAGFSFALSWAELPDPSRVEPALQQMREALASKLQARAEAPRPLQVPGMTPNPQALTQRLAGGEQHAQLAVFARGPVVYQALMLGPRYNDTAWDSFAGSLRLAP